MDAPVDLHDDPDDVYEPYEPEVLGESEVLGEPSVLGGPEGLEEASAITASQPRELRQSGESQRPREPQPADLDQITRVWPAVVEMVRGGNAMLGGMIAPAKPVSATANEVVLAFPAEAEFQRRKCEQDEHRRAAEEALKNVTGVKLAIRYELAAPGPVAVVEADPEPVEAMSEDELVHRLVEEFGAKEISDQEQDSDQEQESEK